MKSLYAASLGLLSICSCHTEEQRIRVSNSTDTDRINEIVAIEIKQPDRYAVYTAEGKPIPCQTSYDGKILFAASVKAKESTHYILRESLRMDVDTLVTGKIYPQWYDDFAWENDKIGFRTYASTMKKSNPNLFGYDIFTKRAAQPVLDVLYGTQFDPDYKAFIHRTKENNPGQSRQLSTAISYHVDHGLGMDYYVVGPTLGCGTAALLTNDSIHYPTFYRRCEVLEEGALRLTFRLTFDPVMVDGEEITEIRTISLDKGSHFNHIQVEYKNLTHPKAVAIGLVLHDRAGDFEMSDDVVAYAEPKHHFGWQTYNAVIFPEEQAQEVAYFDTPKGQAQGHLLSKGVYTPKDGLSYYMGAGWNRWGFKTSQDWFDYVKEQVEIKKHPLTVYLE